MQITDNKYLPNTRISRKLKIPEKTFWAVLTIVGCIAFGFLTAFVTQPMLLIAFIGFSFFCFIFFISDYYGLVALLLIRPILDSLWDLSLFDLLQTDFLNPAGITTIVIILITVMKIGIRKTRIIKTKTTTWLQIFIIISAISIIFSVNRISAFGEILRYISFFAIFINASQSINSIKKIKEFLNLIIISSILPSFVGLMQIIKGDAKIVLGIPQITSLFTHQNVFAIFLTIIISITAVLSILEENKLKKRCYLIYLIILTYLLLKTYARVGWVGVLISLFLLFSAIKRNYLLIAPILLVIFVTNDPYITQRVNLIFTSTIQTNSLISRLELWKVAFHYFLSSPFFGIGLKSFNLMPQTILLLSKPFGTSFHNMYLQVLTETGIFGLIALTLVFFNMHSEIYNFYKTENNKEIRAIYFGFISLLMAVIAMACVDNIFSPVIQWYLWAYFGALIGLRECYKNSFNVTLEKSDRKSTKVTGNY